MQFFTEIKKWLGEITEIALLLIALGIAAGILFGTTIPFFSNILGNLIALIKSLGDNGLVGLIALGIVVYLFNKKRLTT